MKVKENWQNYITGPFNEVKSGTECGIGVKNYNDVKNGDQIECYRMVESKK